MYLEDPLRCHGRVSEERAGPAVGDGAMSVLTQVQVTKFSLLAAGAMERELLEQRQLRHFALRLDAVGALKVAEGDDPHRRQRAVGAVAGAQVGIRLCLEKALCAAVFTSLTCPEQKGGRLRVRRHCQAEPRGALRARQRIEEEGEALVAAAVDAFEEDVGLVRRAVLGLSASDPRACLEEEPDAFDSPAPILCDLCELVGIRFVRPIEEPGAHAE